MARPNVASREYLRKTGIRLDADFLREDITCTLKHRPEQFVRLANALVICLACTALSLGV